VAEVRDRLEIAAVVARYASGVDRRDWDRVASCFAADAEVEGSRTVAPIEEYLAELRPGVEYFPATMHFIGNQLIELSGDSAAAETYAVAYHWKGDRAGEDHPGNLVLGVRYQDTLARRGGRWVIVRRHVDPDWRVGPYPEA
jgi:hypothetical protein